MTILTNAYPESSSWSTVAALKAIANENRLRILGWLLDPTAHFPPQRDGDLVEDGVCVGFITDKIGLSQPTVTSHMSILADAGLVTHRKIKNWVFYKPDRQRIARLRTALDLQLGAMGGKGKETTNRPDEVQTRR
ncbi:helix-turn-helix domain-containing protein [Sphingobium sp. AS12]|uniref:ArsR/SmtB family transcription factor n=1 Tax=Sphingobium sp. AS12 TaxID=2849495 RepID=UPI001C314D06|nr:metalloregulator ArsR/SmtB family transcription factor [Sphingobium sp. AS12]MBV2149849.1 helix-turn-helix domain-containing protein [Sphingobium sp. AS12]